ncbi:hypothetical protein RRG08_013909 [Elysia crispata]|uniref:Uncharacterized protein n=1 Tax=Elysia crispata TaxID=231223 RepID=A0AAE0Z7Y7_9GAST|nr:hypothetical protein RRG08_013909 [Elysia crispata]
MAAETNTLKEFIDRVGLLPVLELIDRLSFADASKFSAYLAENLGYHHHKPTNSDVLSTRSVVRRDDDDDSGSSSSDEDDDAQSGRSNLNAAEKRVWNEIQTAAAGTDGLTDLVALADYATIFGLLENMNEAEASQLLNTLETQLRQEKKRNVVRRDDDGDDSGSSSSEEDDGAQSSRSNLNAAEKRVWNEIQTAAAGTDGLTDLVALADYATIFGLLENMNEAEASQLLNTLETQLRQEATAVLEKRDNDNENDNEFSQLLGSHSNFYSNLSDMEKNMWDAMKHASDQNRLTRYITDHGYGIVFGLLENMSVTEANHFLHTMERQLQKEAAMTV